MGTVTSKSVECIATAARLSNTHPPDPTAAQRYRVAPLCYGQTLLCSFGGRGGANVMVPNFLTALIFFYSVALSKIEKKSQFFELFLD